jgi:Tol biopolymer transport system component
MNKFCSLLPAFLLVAQFSCSPGAQRSGNFRIAIVPSRSGQHGIFVMNSDSSGGKLLTPDSNAQLRPSSWSPDGKKIVFFSYRREDAEIMNKFRIPSHFPIYIMEASGSNQKRLLDFPVSGFSWSPDSRKLLFTSAYEDPAKDDLDIKRGARAPMSAVYVLDLSTGAHKRLTAFGQNCFASWSPNGSLAALSLGSNGEANIYVVSLDGKVARHFTNSATMDLRPAWSPDGQTIAYAAVPSLNADAQDAGVYIIKADGSGKKRISSIIAYDVYWSPDGKKLLLLSSGGIYLLALDDGKILSISTPSDRPLDAVFTPDGMKVMFRSNLEGDWYLYAVDLKGENRKRISSQLTASLFCLSPLLTK